MNSPSAKRKLQRSLDAETLQGRRLFKMLPDAFVFSYAGSDGNLVRLTFRPNPSFHPPSMEARVFHDMEGEMWIDCKQERLAGFYGHLTQTVKFGFGLLGHLDKGGHFEVRQAEVVPRPLGYDCYKCGDHRKSSLVRDHRNAEKGNPWGLPPSIR